MVRKVRIPYIHRHTSVGDEKHTNQQPDQCNHTGEISERVYHFRRQLGKFFLLPVGVLPSCSDKECVPLVSHHMIILAP